MITLRPFIAFAFVASAFAADATVTADGKPVLTLPLPTGWTTATTADSRTVLIPAQKSPHIQIWCVTGTVTEVAAKAAALIVSEVKDFAPTATVDLTIAGAPAKRLSGPGVEADDGDPSNAEVTVFTAAGHTFLCVSHGEGGGTAQRSAELAGILATAK